MSRSSVHFLGSAVFCDVSGKIISKVLGTCGLAPSRVGADGPLAALSALDCCFSVEDKRVSVLLMPRNISLRRTSPNTFKGRAKELLTRPLKILSGSLKSGGVPDGVFFASMLSRWALYSSIESYFSPPLYISTLSCACHCGWALK